MVFISAGMGMDATPQQEAAGERALSERVAELVKQLGADSPTVRQAATEELTKLGASVLNRMKALSESQDLEIQTRAQKIVQEIENEMNGYAHCPLSAEEAKARQHKCAESQGVSVEKEVNLGGEVKITLVLIPAGEFDMGSVRWKGELPIHRVGRVGENCYSRSDTAVNEVGRFEHPGAVGINRDDDDVGRLDGLVHNEYPSSGPQNRSANGGDADDNSPREHENRQDPGPSWPLRDHARLVM